MSDVMSGSAPNPPPRPESVGGPLTEVRMSIEQAQELLEDGVRLAADTIGLDLCCGITLEGPGRPGDGGPQPRGGHPAGPRAARP